MKRILACLGTLALLVSIAPPSAAQEQQGVLLSLVRQTPWNSPKSPEVDVTFRATNTTSQTYSNLSAVITVRQHVQSVSQYELSLTEDPTLPQGFSVTKPLKGTLPPNSSRTFTVSRNLKSLPNVASLVYPMEIEFGSGSRALATLRTPVVYLVEQPKTPLGLGWTFPLDAPIVFQPGGVFRNPTLERQLATGGRLAAEIGALRSITPTSAATHVDVAIDPALVVQLERMADGYTVRDGGTLRHVPAGEGGAADAKQALDDLAHIAGADQVEMSAMPFADPLLPALGNSGLGGDVAVQVQRGQTFLHNRFRQATLDERVMRPPQSSIDPTTLQQLSRQGASLLLLDGNAAQPPPTGLVSHDPPVEQIPLGRSRSIDAVVPEGQIQAMLASPLVSEDPVLGAHLLVADLAEIWLESPSVARSVALMLPEQLPIPSSFFGPFARGVASAPWLTPLKATKLAEGKSDTPTLSHVGVWHGPTFSGDYVQSLKKARKRIDAYRSALVGPSPLPGTLETSLLFAEADDFTSAERLGKPFIDVVHRTIAARFSQVRADVSQPVTLTSSGSVSSIPVHIVNASGTPLHVTVQLVSPRLSFANGNSRSVGLTSTDSTLSFGVTPNTTGRFPVQVLVRTPSGKILSSATLIVRSTAYNRIALLITIGALLVLLALWLRRALANRRAERKQPAPEPEREPSAP
ncbi:MAG: DUF6049 family protein [Actinomycetota bacterium]